MNLNDPNIIAAAEHLLALFHHQPGSTPPCTGKLGCAFCTLRKALDETPQELTVWISDDNNGLQAAVFRTYAEAEEHRLEFIRKRFPRIAEDIDAGTLHKDEEWTEAAIEEFHRQASHMNDFYNLTEPTIPQCKEIKS